MGQYNRLLRVFILDTHCEGDKACGYSGHCPVGCSLPTSHLTSIDKVCREETDNRGSVASLSFTTLLVLTAICIIIRRYVAYGGKEVTHNLD